MNIRLLNADEISAKPRTVYNGSALILLYKDAWVDMTLLDETFGPMNWKRSHKEIAGNLFCTISVWDNEKALWVEKEDVGVESMTDKEKGEASDSFKRAGTNWGIGRELYTSPKITVKLDNGEYKDKKVFTSFYVGEIGYNNKREITKIVIIDGRGKERFKWENGQSRGNEPPVEKEDDLKSYRTDIEVRILNSDLPKERIETAMKGLSSYDKRTLDSVDKMLSARGF